MLESEYHITNTDLSQPLCIVGDSVRTYRDLLVDSSALEAAIRTQLPKHDEIWGLCVDPYACCVSLVAAWRAGRVLALPPTHLSRQALGLQPSLHDDGDITHELSIDVRQFLEQNMVVYL